MATHIHEQSPAMPSGGILGRGIAATHATFVGFWCLFLVYAPCQVMQAIADATRNRALRESGQQPDPEQVGLVLSFYGIALILSVAAIFIVPLIQGGILGQLRDRLETPIEPPKTLAAYSVYYARLLESSFLFAAVSLGVVLLFLLTGVLPTPLFEGLALSGPLMLAIALIGASLIIMTIVVYSVANCIVVSEDQEVLAAWRQSLHFCRQNFPAVLGWALLLLAGFVLHLLFMLSNAEALWALTSLALLETAIVSYGMVLLAGVMMSLYLTRRPQPESRTVDLHRVFHGRPCVAKTKPPAAHRARRLARELPR